MFFCFLIVRKTGTELQNCLSVMFQEERELSPISQNKLDEIWGTVVEGRGKSRLSSMQATAGASLRSPNLEEIDRLSEFSDERRSLERDSDRKGKKIYNNTLLLTGQLKPFSIKKFKT